MRRKSHSRLGHCLLGVLLSSVLGCNVPEGAAELAPPPLLHSRMAETALSVAEGRWAHLPVPPEDGPRLLPVRLAVLVYSTPSKQSEPVGYLRLGERVARSAEPVSTAGCKGGWYAVRPLGFVCQDDDATLAEDHPLVRAFHHAPDRTKPLPYQYAFVRAVAPNYLKVPTKAEQLQYEMRLERHLRSYQKLKDSWDTISPGANDVPLGPSGAAVGGVPKEYSPPGLNERYGGSGDDTVPWWLEGSRKVPNVSTFRSPPYAVIAGRIKRHAGVALVDSFVAGDEAENRRFAVSVDGRLIPADKLKADAASTFHGYELGDVQLPVGFAHRPETSVYSFDSGRPERGVRLAHREMVPLSGKARTWGGERYVEARDGRWLRSADLKVAAAPSQLPWFAKSAGRWIDLSILSQTLVLYEGKKPVYVTLVSTGRDGLGDPKETLSTPTGTFRVYQKHVTHTMDSSVADSEFELRDVPWVMYFQGGYALHAAYWHDDFGRPRSHGCVNLSPIDARYVFNWSLPDVPQHWHGGYVSEAMGKGTMIHIHE